MSRVLSRLQLSPLGGSNATTVPVELSEDTLPVRKLAEPSELLTLDSKDACWIAWSPDGARLAAAVSMTANPYSDVRIWDASSGEVLLEVWCSGRRDRFDRARRVEFSPDGSRLLAAGHRCARLLDAFTGEELMTVKHSEQPYESQVTSAVFAPDGARFATSGVDCTARIWGLDSGAELLRINAPDRPGGWGVHDAAFSPDGTWLATAWDQALRVHDAVSGNERAFVPSRAMVGRVVISPDGELLAADISECARIYETDSWTEQLAVLDSIHAYPGYVRRISSVDFSCDGGQLATVCVYGGLPGSGTRTEVWDTATGRLLTWVKRGLGQAVFAPEGPRIATFVDGGKLTVWGLDLG